MKYFIDESGSYIGAFDAPDGVDFPAVPDGCIEVNCAPCDARQKWDGTKWLPLADEESNDLAESHIKKYGVTEEQLLNIIRATI